MIVAYMSSARLFVAAALVVCAAACNSDSTSPSSNGSTLAPSVNTAVTQLTVVDVALGTGAVANSGNRITVSYSGFLFDASGVETKGRQFDSSNAFTFTLGSGQVIKGWDQGLIGMRVGGLRRLTIPPSLGYGNQAVGTIPANSTLVFDVRLISVG
jgi:FKBP-type peptidyl-prolyl cis-trans isomerase FkpA